MISDQELIRTMMQAAGGEGPAFMSDVDVAEYDWSAPHHFGGDQLQALGELGAPLGEQLSRALHITLGTEMSLQSGPPREVYSGQLKQNVEGQPSYHMTVVGTDGAVGGYVAVGVKRAADWVATLLGGASSDDREMSELELSLLTDVMTPLSVAVCEAMRGHAGSTVTPADTVSTNLDALGDADSDEYCVFVYHQGEESDEPVVTVALADDEVDNAERTEGQGEKSIEQRRQEMIEHMGDMRGGLLSVHLGNAAATVRDLVALEPDDILVLDRLVSEPLDFLVNGKPVSVGRPVTCEGKYAVQIAQPLREPTE